jgi:hypothetical protein
MLDVHPPDHAAHTWRDFFIHIATIVIGLLIAIGLEQSVEYFHHRHQVAETRRALYNERLINIHRFAAITTEFHRYSPLLRTNLAIFVYLRQHPGAPPEQWPGTLNWGSLQIHFYDTAWTTATQNNVLDHMPEAEVRVTSKLYARMHGDNAALDAFEDANVAAARYTLLDPDAAHLSPAQLDRQIDLTLQAVSLLVQQAGMLRSLADEYPDFSPAPSEADIDQIAPRRSPAYAAYARHVLEGLYLYDRSLGEGAHASPSR